MSRNHHVYEELADAIDLTIHTKSPGKWLLVDRETGQTYVGNAGGYWDKLIPKQREDLNGAQE